MKILVLSDTHLTDEFDQALCDYISDLVKSVDKVILNGDIWDGYVTSFDSFVTSKWQQLFALFKEKQAVYIYGNHDRQEMADDRVSEFSTQQTLQHSFIEGEKRFHVEHGHLIAPELDDRHPTLISIFTPLAPLFFRLLAKRTMFNRVINWAFIDPRQKKLDQIMCKYAKNQLQTLADIVIFGHSHTFHKTISREIYWNSGCVEYTNLSYLLITDGVVTPVTAQYSKDLRIV